MERPASSLAGVGLVAAVDALVRGGAPAEPLEVETDEAPPYPP
jgi:hypothetical protein